MPIILQAGYETAIRSKLGARISELPDADINQSLVLDLAEATIAGRVPDYALLVSGSLDSLMLQNAVVSLIGSILAPSMYRRMNTEVTTIDAKWKKDKVDWDRRALDLLGEVETSLSAITAVTVDSVGTFPIMAIATATEEGEV